MSNQSRKDFIKKVSLITFGSVMLQDVVFAKNLSKGPFKNLTEGDDLKSMKKSSELTVLNNRPWNVETPAHLLDDLITPADKLFVRNNGLPPNSIDVDNWKLTIEGESAEKTVSLSIAELKSKFKHYTYQLTIECGGNGRNEFNPPAKGNQ